MRHVVAAIVLVFATAGVAQAQPRTDGPPNFVSVCRYDHQLPDDPIVSPGQPGASHLHDFFANTTTDASSTYESLQAGGTSCRNEGDTAAYWAPSLYDDGVRVEPRLVRAYYQTGGKRPASIEPFPAELKMLATRSDLVRYACVGGDADGSGRPVPPQCEDGSFLVVRIGFPDCWDGVNLDSADHASHMAFHGRRGRCPSTHPVPVPRLLLAVRYPGSDGGAITFAGGSSAHADLFNAWDQPTLEALVERCLNGRVHCGAI